MTRRTQAEKDARDLAYWESVERERHEREASGPPDDLSTMDAERAADWLEAGISENGTDVFSGADASVEALRAALINALRVIDRLEREVRDPRL